MALIVAVGVSASVMASVGKRAVGNEGEGSRQSARNLRQTPSLQVPALQPEEVAGTLANGAVFITDSSLGKHAGLGLFAGRLFAAGDRITSYEGVIRYREEIKHEAALRLYANEQRDMLTRCFITDRQGSGKTHKASLLSNRTNRSSWATQ